MVCLSIIRPKLQKMPTQKDLSNKASITSYMITSRGGAGIGYLEAHKDI